MDRKQLSLLALATLILLPVGYVVGSWYWTSQTITHTLTVEGSITAKTNFNPLTELTDGTTWTPYGEVSTMDGLIDGAVLGLPAGQYMFILVDSANTETLTVRVSVICVPSVSCEVVMQGITLAGEFGGVVSLGEIATDGSESVVLTDGLDPLWLIHSTTSRRVLRLRFVFGTNGLAVGSYPVEVVVSLGD